MKLVNKDRIRQVIEEHQIFEQNLDVLDEMRLRNNADGKQGLIFCAQRDGSGLATEHFFKYGKFDAILTDEILTAVIAIVEKYKLDLESEIENL